MTAHERWMRHLRDAIVETIAEIPSEQRDDVYVIHLTLESPDDDNRRVIATVAWNTVQHLRAEQAEADARERMTCEWFSRTFAEPRARVIGEADADVDLRTEIAHTLHADGTFERILGKDVPVLIDTDLDDEDGLRVLNRQANPASFYPELDRWSARWLADA